MERVIRLRKQLPALGSGKVEVLDTGAKAVLAHRCAWRGQTVVVLHNLSGEQVQVRLDAEVTEELLADGDYDEPGSGPLELHPYGYRWLRVS
jgi:maltose alpha-D-glucosyltransferase/alpha-amylase